MARWRFMTARSLAAVGLILLGAGETALGQRGGSKNEASAQLKQSVSRNDLGGMSRAMEAMLPSGDGSGEKLATRLLERGTPAQRAVAAGVIGRRARVADLATIVVGLDRSKYQDERRWLVGAIGSRARALAPNNKQGQDELRAIVAVLVPLVQDQDFQVRAAAMRGLADARTPSGLLDAKFALPRAPGLRGAWADHTEQGIFTWAVYGTASTLLGVRAESENEVVSCMRDRAGEIRALEPGRVLPGPSPQRQPVHFEMIERHADLTDGEIDRLADGVLASARAYFPGACLPPLRLIVTDAKGMAKVGAPPQGFSGMWGGNTLGVVVDEHRQMLAMLAHEYALTVCSSQFVRQPVWMMEGMAASLTASASMPMYGPGRSVPAEVAPLIDAGAFQTLARWAGGAIPNDDENARFTLSHVAVNYLRYRGFAEHEARLNAMMGMLSRGASTQQALEAMFDTPIERLDDDLRAWLRGEAKPLGGSR